MNVFIPWGQLFFFQSDLLLDSFSIQAVIPAQNPSQRQHYHPRRSETRTKAAIVTADGHNTKNIAV